MKFSLQNGKGGVMTISYMTGTRIIPSKKEKKKENDDEYLCGKFI
jgi:hypothetical protein